MMAVVGTGTPPPLDGGGFSGYKGGFSGLTLIFRATIVVLGSFQVKTPVLRTGVFAQWGSLRPQSPPEEHLNFNAPASERLTGTPRS